ncbi:hypothetical protein ACPSL3_10005 [Vibrio owensii]|uniref:hypothetical protein n=1 Tax=Vibrio owensii TaxID=696485 RepID=UPI003CE453F0
MEVKLVGALIGFIGVLVGLLFGHLFTEQRQNNEIRLAKLEALLRQLLIYKRLNQVRYDQSIDFVELEEGSYENLVKLREDIVTASDEIRLLTFTYFRECEEIRIAVSNLQQEIEPLFLENNLGDSIASGNLKKQFWELINATNSFEQFLLKKTKLPT